MKTYTKCDELTAAVNSIIEIIDWKVLGTKDLADKPRFVAWKEAVSRVVEVVDSMCEIARITHEIPLTVIVAKRFCKWHERVGRENEGHPFPKWGLIMNPDKATFDDHPWLQTIERRFDLQCTSFKMSAFPPAAEPLSEMLLKATSCKGKEKALDAEVKVMIGDDDGKDEMADEDAEMGGDTIHYKPAQGWPSMRQVATSGSRQPARRSQMPKPKLVKQEEVDELDEEDDEEEDVDMDRPVKIVVTSVPTPTCPAFGSKKNPSHTRTKKRSRSSLHPDDEDANDDDDADYATTHPEKKPRTSNASKCPPESWSHPVVMIPHGRPVIHLPVRLAPNPTHVSHAHLDHLPSQPPEEQIVCSASSTHDKLEISDM
ncbi:hypothetical protein BKA82DRAFT_22733 [Pisolithus tinctorius]|uniref:Uncharacterized protein n=1 Tax=Pisolithus tinctorius Marx 270 TaxID=870435 RepID=A0A0C3KH58_PISTI|nr:hypothetical protein BKA82DRAFT_22733 [Pisolithus tinctorius]KIO08922.1 hypothetical protein M404DRAFT_22733 [Pisolithus tinctorius Marx 270]